ncbi:hypothetical protein FDP08_19865 [Marinobacter panjinensis]|uniref:MSHA biogenesis protein MshP n=1 Tax=Marinobacter panjinensis TaxID=2576384 RepID=A0A4U6QRF3_9GAMM|nr:hypothetical protein [Marinobacter panjinensis]MCR8916421.1 hypothetical protein [Marinobacter panjinensis]TKV63360.1 hypothetical protein FDP08_19865 [Marinobacter panjinensis]
MYRDPGFNRQNGAGLPVALFIITVLALLVLGMAQLQESSSESVSLQIQSQRAFFAAESGAQAGVASVLNDADPPSVCPALGSSWSVNFPSAALAGCEAAIFCSSADTPGIGGSGGNRIYSLASTGQCGSGPDRAERSVEVRFR